MIFLESAIAVDLLAQGAKTAKYWLEDRGYCCMVNTKGGFIHDAKCRSLEIELRYTMFKRHSKRWKESRKPELSEPVPLANIRLKQICIIGAEKGLSRKANMTIAVRLCRTSVQLIVS